MSSSKYLVVPHLELCDLDVVPRSMSASCVRRNLKLRGALTGVWLGARNDEEMNCMAPSHSPSDSISVDSQPHGRVCERSAHKYPPHPTHPHTHRHTQHPKGASLMVMAKGCRCLGD